jgi:uncharacterized coiled-coil DUF342 family protein
MDTFEYWKQRSELQEKDFSELEKKLERLEWIQKEHARTLQKEVNDREELEKVKNELQKAHQSLYEEKHYILSLLAENDALKCEFCSLR